ncbi:hypothetical protein I4U23_001294 [Adineta vaga]|nr:hypothetical protein I4U23_001294 [Adineta vaga]
MSIEDDFDFASRQLHIYFGLFILILGVIGGLLNLIVFIILKTFRETACAFYLTAVSVVNVCQLLIALLIRILSEGFDTDIRKRSSICKGQIFMVVWCLLMSIIGICLATIDQYLSMTKYRHLSNLRSARRNFLFTCFLCGIYSICYSRFWDVSSGNCSIINSNFVKYSTYFHFPVLLGLLPISIMVTFSLLAYYNARSFIHQQVNIIYSSRDRQLTAMTLVHVVFFIITTSPHVIFFIYSLNRTTNDPKQIAYKNLLNTIIVLINYSSNSGPFYIYCCVSERFRKQFVYVLTKFCINPCRQQIQAQVVPTVEGLVDRHPTRTRTFNEMVSFR